ncbi:hypothetical protein TNCV_1563911 [Trichonephila clavipes]|nr:hypothetical protein TNCV_1563911 [Trichonephila clavipes]
MTPQQHSPNLPHRFPPPGKAEKRLLPLSMNSIQLRSSLSGAASLPRSFWAAVVLLLPFGAACCAICVQIAPVFFFFAIFSVSLIRRRNALRALDLKTGSPLREGSQGYSGVVTPAFTKDSKPLGKKLEEDSKLLE